MAPVRPRLERILCPTDFSEFSKQALAHAVRLARWFDARLTVLHVAAAHRVPAEAAVAPFVVPLEPGEPEPEAATAELDRFVEPALDEGVAVETRVAVGRPAAEIVSAAEGICADLVVMGTHGRSGFEHLVLGSVTEKVARKAGCPVLSVGNVPPSSVAPLFRRILCASDLTGASDATLDMALSLAEENMARVTLLHVVESLPQAVVHGALGAQLGQFQRQLVAEARKRLERAAHATTGFCDVEQRVEKGTPWREILRVAEQCYADLIVVGAHARGAVSRSFFGSTANHVMRQAGCPVLVVRESARRTGRSSGDAAYVAGARQEV
jgi:nucleotide-binding universal stress UspA family protein